MLAGRESGRRYGACTEPAKWRETGGSGSGREGMSRQAGVLTHARTCSTSPCDTRPLSLASTPPPPPARLLPCAVGTLSAAIKCAAALAAVSGFVDLSGGRLVGTGMVDDGATPPRRIYPYNS